MGWPTGADYGEVIQNLRSSVADDELRAGEAAVNALGLPMVWSGSFADVYKIECPATGNTWALKCFTREVPGLCDRYRDIALCLDEARLPFTVDFRYVERGVRVDGVWFPALKMRWVEGRLLNHFIEDHLDRPKALQQLLDYWVKLAARLREARVAHADLQHGNVILVPTPRAQSVLRLIDYDGMFVPQLAGTRSGELGHPAYQHPQRLDQGTYNVEVDRFSHLAICCSIRALVTGGAPLWHRFNNGDNLLFRESDFRNPGDSDVFRTLWGFDQWDARAMAGWLALACVRPLEDAPRLDEVVDGGKVVPLNRQAESEVNRLLGIEGLHVVPSAPWPPAPTDTGSDEPWWGSTATRSVARRPPPLPKSLASASSGTVSATATGTIPAAASSKAPASELQAELVSEEPQPPRRIAALLWLVTWTLLLPFRRVDRFLGQVAGRHGGRLHWLLRAVVAGSVAAGLGLAGIVALTPPPAVYRVELNPPGAKLTATGKRVTIESDGSSHIVTVAWPDSARQVVLRATLSGYGCKTATLTPKPGESETLSLHLERLAPEVTNSIDMKFVLIRAGHFMMGSPESDDDAEDDEKPQHSVDIEEDFYLGVCEVTQQQYEEIMGHNPSRFTGDPQRPVEQVSWNDADAFCRRLSGQEGVKYRLPTEPEWEYACRAGSTTRWCFGNSEDQLDAYACLGKEATHLVAQKEPNAWGLYDMHGNVSEWCEGSHEAYGCDASTADDPTGRDSQEPRVCRGGSWRCKPRYTRSAERFVATPEKPNDSIGFRVARTP